MSTNLRLITDALTTKINDVDFVDASHVNNLQQAVKQLAGCSLTQAGYSNIEYLSATRLLTDDDLIYQIYTMTGTSQTVQLPPVSNENHPFLIWNSDDTRNLLINDGSGALLMTLYPKDYALLIQMGGLWISFKAGFDPYFNIQVVLGDGLNVMTPGVKGDVEVPYNCEVVGWSIYEGTGTAGTIVVDVWRDIYANFPPTVGDTITGSEKPALSAAVRNQDVSLTTWTKTLNKGDVLRFNVDSAATLKQVTVCLKCKRV
jgi:hypothetical protein